MKKVQILGTGCLNCRRLMQNTQTAAEELGLLCEIEKITDIKAIRSLGVMMTPALAIDDHVKIAGRVPSVTEIQKILFLGEIQTTTHKIEKLTDYGGD